MATDWGSVADWVSGIGSIVVGVAALGVAWMERQRAIRAETALDNRNAELHNDLIVEGLRLIQLVRTTGSRLHWGFEKSSVEEINAGKPEWIEANRTVKDAITDLLRFPISDPSLFRTLVDIKQLSDLPDRIAKWDWPELSAEVERRLGKMDRINEEMMSHADPKALLKW